MIAQAKQLFIRPHVALRRNPYRPPSTTFRSWHPSFRAANDEKLNNHQLKLLGQFARSGAKVASRPKVSPPLSLFQIGKTFKQLHRASSFDSSHDLARRKLRRRRDKNMDMILTNNSFDDFSTKASHVCLINSRTFNPTSPFNTL